MGWTSLDNLLKTTDMSHRVQGGNGLHSSFASAFSSYVGTDYVLWSEDSASGGYARFPTVYSDGVISMDPVSLNSGAVLLPIIPTKISDVEFDVKLSQPSITGTVEFQILLESSSFSYTRIIQRINPTYSDEWEHISVHLDSYTDFYYICFTTCAKFELKNFSVYAVETTPSGGAGSGYIGNSLVSNKKMVGYNVPTSSAESTKTESVNEASESPVSGKPKIGNGHAKIKLIREHEQHSFESIIRQTDVTHKKTSTSWSINALREYFGTDWNLEYDMWSRGKVLTKTNDEYSVTNAIGDYYYAFQFPEEIYITKIEFDLKIPSSGGQYVFIRLIPMYYDDNSTYNAESFILQKNSTASYDNTDVLIPLDKNDYGHYTKEYSTPQKASMFRFYTDVGDYYFKNLKIYTI